MDRILKTIHLAPSYEGEPHYIITITEREILYAQLGSNRWSLATVTLLEVDTPFRDEEITHPRMPTHVDDKDAYIREVKYRHMKNDRIAALEELLQKEIAEKDELYNELDRHKNIRYEVYRALESL
jgi:hypothetical protein